MWQRRLRRTFLFRQVEEPKFLWPHVCCTLETSSETQIVAETPRMERQKEKKRQEPCTVIANSEPSSGTEHILLPVFTKLHATHDACQSMLHRAVLFERLGLRETQYGL